MVFFDILKGAFKSLAKPNSDFFCDCVDMLNFRYTSGIFVIFSAALCVNQYIFRSIQCWVPGLVRTLHHFLAQFHTSWEQYVENYCWVQSTYWVPLNHPSAFTDVDKLERENRLSYYQWIPFILFFQAFLFYLPFLIWININSYSGTNIEAIRTLASDYTKKDVKDREQIVVYCTGYISRTVNLLRRYQRRRAWTVLDRYVKPVYLTSAYLVIKVMFLANALGQFFFLNAVLGTKDVLYGMNLLWNLMEGVDWQVSGIFPRVTFCIVEEKALANLNKHTIQCVLPSNMVAEKIFVFMWFWLAVVLIITAINIIWWACLLLIPRFRVDVVRSWLISLPDMYDCYSEDEYHLHIYEKRLKYFVDRYLQFDGVFILRMISVNFGVVLTSEIVQLLWKDVLKKEASIAVCLGIRVINNYEKDATKQNGSQGNFDEKYKNDNMGKVSNAVAAVDNNKQQQIPIVVQVGDDEGFMEQLSISSSGYAKAGTLPSDPVPAQKPVD